MSLTSKDFEDNLIRTIIGVMILVVGAALVATSGNLIIRTTYYIVFGALIFVVGIILIYYALKILLALLEKIGSKESKKS